jgi:transcriptional regulator with XRE-family HTH domain
MTVGERVKRWREARELGQRQAAAGAGISQAAWQAIETGRVKRIGLEVARHVVAYMGGEISLEDLCPRGRLPKPGPLPRAHDRKAS